METEDMFSCGCSYCIHTSSLLTLSSTPAQAMTWRAMAANTGLNSRVISLALGGSMLAMRTAE